MKIQYACQWVEVFSFGIGSTTGDHDAQADNCFTCDGVVEVARKGFYQFGQYFLDKTK